jgi:hypothetical protein
LFAAEANGGSRNSRRENATSATPPEVALVSEPNYMVAFDEFDE